MDFWRKLLLRKVTFSLYQVAPCMLLVQVSWFLKHNNLVIRLYRVYDFDRKDDQGNLRELHLEKSIDVLNIGEPANSRPVTTKVDDLKSTLLVASDFFAVYKWEISGKADFEKTADYSLFSVLDGQGSLLVDDQEYQIAKGSHFILPSDVQAWEIKGDLELIVSHP